MARTRKDVDEAHPVQFWIRTPNGGVISHKSTDGTSIAGHRASPYLIRMSTIGGAPNFPVGVDTASTWHTVDLRGTRDDPEARWQIADYLVEFQPNFPSYELPLIEEVSYEGTVILNGEAGSSQRIIGAYRAPGSSVGDDFGMPELLQGFIPVGSSNALRGNVSGVAPVIDGKTEFRWERVSGTNEMGFSLRLTGYRVRLLRGREERIRYHGG